MRFVVKHELQGRDGGRLRVSLCRGALTAQEADLLLAYIQTLPGVTQAKVYERTAGAAVCYRGDREALLAGLTGFSFTSEAIRELAPKNTGRALNLEYKEKLIQKVAVRAATKIFFPAPLRAAYTTCQAVRYLAMGLRSLCRRRLEVEVLDATAITVSLLRRDYDTAGSVMFLLGIGELLEEWTHKKSVGDLARSMSLQVQKVWVKTEAGEVLTPVSRIKEGDLIVVRMGTLIPLDGEVASGEAMVNQASMTGESLPVHKSAGSYVYAGTAVEEGQLLICVKKAAGSTRYERIVHMIEESEKLKSSMEGKAAALADALVPWSLGATAVTWLVTRNATKAISILMVDFSCALKLAMPLSVLSAMREASQGAVTVKGGKFLEAVAEADTIVFDKTGTLTKARPTVADVVSFNGMSKNELLRLAACLEEHFPHSMANAVVQEAVRRGLIHEEVHSRVDYIVAHGIATYVEEERVIIGSYHFVFEDEGCVLPDGERETFDALPEEYSHLYMAIGGRLAAVICIEDPLREEAPDVIRALRRCGFSHLVMMTGDSERTARAIARRVGVDEYRSEVLPEDKADFIEEMKQKGHRVVMVGDGINDSPALSAADAGIAVSQGAEIAREIADIMIAEDSLTQLVFLKELSCALVKRIRGNYRFVIGFNLGLILLGVGGILTPSMSALLHNTSTLAVSLKSMTNLLPEERETAIPLSR